MVTYDGVTPALSSKKHFTSSDSRRLSLLDEDEQNDDSEVAGGQPQEIDDLDDSLFIPVNIPEGLESSEPKASRRIHLLGGGDVGKFVAHAIAGIPNPPPITLLFRSPYMLHVWHKSDRSLEVVTDRVGEKRSGFETELLHRRNESINAPRQGSDLPAEDSLDADQGAAGDANNDANGDANDGADGDANNGADNAADSAIIHQLILAVSPQTTIDELSRVADRLTQDSTILFMQTGLGIVDEVNEKIFPNETTRPSYLVGLPSHWIYPSGRPFSVVHAKMGTVALGIPLRSSTLQTRTGDEGVANMSHSTLYFMRTLTRTPDLAAVSFAPLDMFQMQLEKCAIFAAIYPLTVLFGCQNGQLKYNGPVTRVIRLLLAEISLVIRSLPELQGVPNVNMRFSPGRLAGIVYINLGHTAEEFSPMLKDVTARRNTGINHLNGYFIQRGEELGIKCVMNYMLMQMVKGKRIAMQSRTDAFLPMEVPSNSDARPQGPVVDEGIFLPMEVTSNTDARPQGPVVDEGLSSPPVATSSSS
ncbi:hypothetical protein MMC22_010215 [Lobaria immixta]|nr:hypothetical protein [Lobaria immixta]